MKIIFIAAITKLANAALARAFIIVRGFVTKCFASLDQWLMPNRLLRCTPMEALRLRAWRLPDHVFDLMASVAGTANIPLEKINGFKRLEGRWYIGLDGIGWLRTSDLLQMQTKIVPTSLEAIK